MMVAVGCVVVGLLYAIAGGTIIDKMKIQEYIQGEEIKKYL